MDFTDREVTIMLYALRDYVFRNESAEMKTEVNELRKKVVDNARIH